MEQSPNLTLPLPKPGLLVSVRSLAEAAAALEGGADLIDIKEPARGPLGRADDTVISRIVRFIAGRRPVSAALGEWVERKTDKVPPGLDYVKWGLARCRETADWRQSFSSLLTRQGSRKPCIVLAAYADWEKAQAPPLPEVETFARQWPGGVLLLDTHDKAADPRTGEKATLLHWLSLGQIMSLCRRCHRALVRVSLAGALDAEHIATLLPASPDWFAVRGAACYGGKRQATIKKSRVRKLVQVLEKLPARKARAGPINDMMLSTPQID